MSGPEPHAAGQASSSARPALRIERCDFLPLAISLVVPRRDGTLFPQLHGSQELAANAWTCRICRVDRLAWGSRRVPARQLGALAVKGSMRQIRVGKLLPFWQRRRVPATRQPASTDVRFTSATRSIVDTPWRRADQDGIRRGAGTRQLCQFGQLRLCAARVCSFFRKLRQARDVRPTSRFDNRRSCCVFGRTVGCGRLHRCPHRTQSCLSMQDIHRLVGLEDYDHVRHSNAVMDTKS